MAGALWRATPKRGPLSTFGLLLHNLLQSLQATRVSAGDELHRPRLCGWLPADDNGIEKLISDRLNAMGYKSSYGTAENPPIEVDAIVTYEDKWMWDMTMYLIRLTVQVRDAKSRSILASAESYRPSLERKSPTEMVTEVLNELFKKEQK